MAGLAAALLVAGCAAPRTGDGEAAPAGERELVVYSGRAESLIGPLVERFEKDTGIRVRVRYGESAELALALLEEGRSSPADVFFTVDPAGVGAVAKAGLLRPLPERVLQRVPARFRARDGRWVGVSGRVRVVAYHTRRLTERDLPASILGYTDARWQGRIGWTPTYGSFQSFVTALRRLKGDDAARAWVAGIVRNRPRAYASNVPMVEAVAAGEIDVAFTNHYYVYRLRAERPDAPVAAYFFRNGDPGGLIIPAAAGILATAPHAPEAERFLEFLLSEPAQRYFAEQTLEYPLVPEVAPAADLPPLDALPQPDLDLGDLDDLRRTLELLRDAGAL